MSKSKQTPEQERAAWKQFCRSRRQQAKEFNEKGKATYDDSPDGKAEARRASKSDES